MTTAHSPLSQLRAQAQAIAAQLKAIERGGVVGGPAHKIDRARMRDKIKFAVVMDDKVLSVEMTWAAIAEYSEAGLAAFILKQMRGSRRATEH